MHDFLEILLWLRHHSVVVMLTVFVLMLISLYLPGRRMRFERDARIPLEDDR
ncbi:cbb3-type cytochrome c oxidase subunit 3 [Limobrevibacterium gyesilva]|uniref:Cbb3-type cytochrome c oxidase subunit 3 n=1 Tax=Limobrevibacterium gyesilva TaxID=2991712 RepID=A0AA42CJD3_9PROT|nr:cbb3-type cytochrome c oxidase subunit 3 [Limobrevibacterium gyesilva]MCW3476765.1 cbb3-type cytochrome c oxidase subunit 3 [Limobrevibacterium gyesilva]